MSSVWRSRFWHTCQTGSRMSNYCFPFLSMSFGLPFDSYIRYLSWSISLPKGPSQQGMEHNWMTSAFCIYNRYKWSFTINTLAVCERNDSSQFQCSKSVKGLLFLADSRCTNAAREPGELVFHRSISSPPFLKHIGDMAANTPCYSR